MPKSSKKQNKQMICHKRIKIAKKVAKRNRRLKREEKKNPSSNLQDDPKSLHSKSAGLEEAVKRQKRAKDMKEAQRASRLKIQMQNREIAEIVNFAQRKEKQYVNVTSDENELKENSQNFKSYFRELKKVVEEADVILEVLDARDPLGCRCPQIEELVIKSGKKLVLVMNKIDLIPRSNLDEWLKYLRQSLPTVAFKASTQSQNSNLSQAKVAAIHINEGLQSSSHCIGASFLMKILGNYCLSHNIKTFIKIGVVGFPNVGKSSIINSLKRSRSCNVGATPGLTKTVQEVALDKHIKILDSPGVVIAKDGSASTLALRNAVRVETLKDVISPAEAIVQRADHEQLCLHYNIPEFNSCNELLSYLAKRMGKYKKGGIPNIDEGARRLINDWNRGIIKYYTHPPEKFDPAVYLSTTIVSEMSKAFDISELEQQMELDKPPEVFSSSSDTAVEASEPTLFNSVSNEEKMEEEDTGSVPSTTKKRVSFEIGTNFNEDNKKVIVDFDKKKERNVEVKEKSFSLASLQKNKALKKKFKKMKKNQRRMNKAADALSDSMDMTLNL